MAKPCASAIAEPVQVLAKRVLYQEWPPQCNRQVLSTMALCCTVRENRGWVARGLEEKAAQMMAAVTTKPPGYRQGASFLLGPCAGYLSWQVRQRALFLSLLIRCPLAGLSGSWQVRHPTAPFTMIMLRSSAEMGL